MYWNNRKFVFKTYDDCYSQVDFENGWATCNGITDESTEPHESYSNFNNQLYRLVNSVYMRKTLLST